MLHLLRARALLRAPTSTTGGAAMRRLMAQAASAVKATPAPVARSGTRKLLILYGSATGTAETFARMVALMASKHNVEPVLATMNDGVSHFTGEAPPGAVVFVVATTGMGEFPRNADEFFDSLASSAGLREAVKATPFAIFGLGNSRNDHFNAAAKRLDGALTSLGATRLTRTRLSCEMDQGGHAAAFRKWRSDMWHAVADAGLGGAAAGGDALPSVYDLTAATGAVAAEEELLPAGFESVRSASNVRLTPPAYGGSDEYLLQLSVPEALQHRMLGGRGVDITDSVEIIPTNPAALVERAARRLGVDSAAVVTVTPLPGSAPSPIDGKRVSVGSLLRAVLDLSAAPTRSFLESMAQAAADAKEREVLDALANDLSPEGEYEKRMRSGAWTVVDVLEEFASVKLSLAQMLSHGARIQPRTYSIAGDTGATPGAVQILYAVPRRPALAGAKGGEHQGLCTSHLASLSGAAPVRARLVPGTIRVPPANQPLFITALGTGVGAARAVLQRRAKAKQEGESVAPAVLFYGFRYKGKDQLFVDEFAKMERDGVLQVTYVPSHEEPGKMPTPMDKFDRSLGDYLGHKGVFMYCGLGGSVPMVVDAALRRAGVDVATLRSSGRYVEEYFTPDVDTENLLRDHGAVIPDVGAATLAARQAGSAMFCFQCEQTQHGTGCTKVGVCGKTPRVAAMQDALIHAAKLLGFYAHRLREMKAPDNADWDRTTLYALFTTLTNVNFDEARFGELVPKVVAMADAAREKYIVACAAADVSPAVPTITPVGMDQVGSIEAIERFGRSVGVLTRFTDTATQNGAAVSEMLMYGLKGIAAYADHSLMNGMEDPQIYAFMHKALAFFAGPDNLDLGQALGLSLEAGKINTATMALLYKSNATLGVPRPRDVPVKPVPGKCILVSGHDLIILEGLLKVTEPLGINVYTHGEMLPAHGYEKLTAFKTLAGHYGGAWMRQAVEFPHFPGPVLMTTNCITEPHKSYRDRIYTAGAVGWAGIPHIGNTMADMDFTSVIERAQREKGFGVEDKEFAYDDPIGVKRPATITVGYGHETILSAAPMLLDQIGKGNITRFFVIGGCDGFEGQRSYYTDLVKQLPKTSVVLTMGCGKFRINHLDSLGTIGDTGVPRILDCGQCNDAFSAVQVAVALAQVLKCEVKDLPLSIVLSWFEQKAVAVLLTCLAMGLKPIRVGPSLPAFVTPDVLGVLVKDFGVKLVGDPVEDAKEMCAAKAMS